MSDGVREEMCREIARGTGGGSIMREIERAILPRREDGGRMSAKKTIYIRLKTVRRALTAMS